MRDTKKSRTYLLRLDYYTNQHLIRIADEWGISRADMIRTHINHEWEHYDNQDMVNKLREGK